MKVEQDTWTIKKLIKQKNWINLNPIWQRGPAWREPRQVLLIDSILREMDIPKVYLRKLGAGAPFKFDAVDGQQRLRALWEFFDDKLPLQYVEPLDIVDGHSINGKTFSQLHQDLQDRFSNFQVSIAQIKEATNDEITNLFSRLQMGVSLNPAELRNAILGPATHVVTAMAQHRFFEYSKIPDIRYKRQDYLTHIMAIAAFEGARNIKAPDLRIFVREYNSKDTATLLELAAGVGEALNVVHEVNQLLNFSIIHKWIFVDLCWFVLRRLKRGDVIEAQVLAKSFAAFDKYRREHTRAPEKVLDPNGLPSKLRRHMYNYLVAFKTQGGTKENLRARAQAFDAFCANV